MRAYPHAGKYEGELLIAAVVDHPEWHNDTCGDVETTGFHALLDGALTEGELDERVKDLPADLMPNAEERAYLMRMAGAILSTDSQGFVSVKFYEDGGQLANDWEQLLDAEGDSDEDD